MVFLDNFTPLDFLQDHFFTKIKITHWRKWSRDRHKTARGGKKEKKSVSFIIVAKKAKKTTTVKYDITNNDRMVVVIQKQ